MVFIYAIKLEKGKYYIGKTNNPNFRLTSHFNSNGSEWTRIYKPLKTLEINDNCDDYDEDKITIKYMNKYGINNVRGGSFVSLRLEPSMINTLKKMLNGANNKCFICGKKGHFAQNCIHNEEVIFKTDDDYEDIWLCQYCGKEFDTEKGARCHENIYCKKKYKKQTFYVVDNYSYDCCFRCGRQGHFASSCYASRHIDGYYLK